MIILQLFQQGFLYLDGYPLNLPCRYSNKVAMYDTVYFTTNIPIEKQYSYIQIEEPETYRAFLRRITEIKEIVKKEPVPTESTDEFEIID